MAEEYGVRLLFHSEFHQSLAASTEKHVEALLLVYWRIYMEDAGSYGVGFCLDNDGHGFSHCLLFLTY